MLLKIVTKNVFYGMTTIRDSYKLRVGNFGMRQDLARKWIETQLIILSPIAPHFCDVLWKEHYLPSLTEAERKIKASLAS
jgi:leucyl-tRNA synthetase